MLDQFHPFAEGLDHPEGVCAGPGGELYAGGEAGQIYRVDLDGTVEQIASTGGFILGLAADADGDLYACDLAHGAVMRIDARGGNVERYTAGTADEPMRAPNYPVFDASGNLYVTASGDFDADDGLLFRVAPGGHTEVWSRTPSNFPNGACLTIDDDALLVVTSTPDPGVTRVPINDDGSAGRPEVLVSLEGTVPDGVALADDGTVFVACYRPDRLYRLSHDGRPQVLAEDPRGTVLAAPTNVVFAGPDLDRLVVGSLGRWHLTVAELGVRGRRLHYPSL